MNQNQTPEPDERIGPREGRHVASESDAQAAEHADAVASDQPPVETAPALLVTDLKRSFSGVKAVAGISFEVPRGSTVSIIGPNGSGKTTTLNLVTGVLAPDSGSVVVDGRSVAHRRPEQVAEAGIRRTFQNGRVFGNLTVAQNIEVALHAGLSAHRPFRDLANLPVLRWVSLVGEVIVALLGTARTERQAMDAAIATQVDRFAERLGPRVSHLAYTLSYANRRRTEIARALAGRPDLLVLDEPTAGMNQTETAEVLDQLLALKAQGQTILLVEHKLDLVMRVSDHVLVMDEGRVIAEGPPAEVRHNPRVIDAYLGRRHAHVSEQAAARGNYVI